VKLQYFPATDSLYINLSSKTSQASEELAEGIVVDFDEHGDIVGIDIDNASRKLELDELVLDHLPVNLQRLTA